MITIHTTNDTHNQILSSAENDSCWILKCFFLIFTFWMILNDHELLKGRWRVHEAEDMLQMSVINGSWEGRSGGGHKPDCLTPEEDDGLFKSDLPVYLLYLGTVPQSRNVAQYGGWQPEVVAIFRELCSPESAMMSCWEGGRFRQHWIRCCTVHCEHLFWSLVVYTPRSGFDVWMCPFSNILKYIKYVFSGHMFQPLQIGLWKWREIVPGTRDPILIILY